MTIHASVRARGATHHLRGHWLPILLTLAQLAAVSGCDVLGVASNEKSSGGTTPTSDGSTPTNSDESSGEGASTAVRTAEVAPGETCPYGGISIDSGIDENGNGVLDADEVDHTEVICFTGVGASEGSVAAPVALAEGEPHQGTVAALGASYYSVAVEEEGTAIIEIDFAESALDIALFSDAGFSAAIGCATDAHDMSAECRSDERLAAGSTAYVKVTELGNLGNAYTIEVALDPYAEGSPAAPVDLTGQLPYNGDSAIRGSFYVVHGLDALRDYGLDAPASETAFLSLAGYVDAEFLEGECFSNGLGKICAANGGGDLFLTVSGFEGEPFQLDVVPLPTSRANPEDISDDLPYAGTVSAFPQFFRLAGLEAEKPYGVEELGHAVSLWSYNTPEYQELDCTGRCAMLSSPDGEIFFAVEGDPNFEGAEFVIRAERVNSSDLAPIRRTIEQFPLAGEVSRFFAYYRITDLVPSRRYGVWGDYSIHVYNERGFTGSSCHISDSPSRDDACEFDANSFGELFVRVEGDSGDQGDPFVFSVEELGSTILEPLDITGMFPYSGVTGRFNAYFVVTGLDPGTTYQMTSTGDIDDVHIEAYLRGGQPISSSQTTCLLEVECTITPSGLGEIYFLLPGAAMSNAGAELGTAYEITLTEVE